MLWMGVYWCGMLARGCRDAPRGASLQPRAHIHAHIHARNHHPRAHDLV